MKKTAVHRPESTHDVAAGTIAGGGRTSSFSTSLMEGGAKRKMMEEEEQQPDAGVDELLAALGYKVRSSDMADVAQKLEQLEMAMSMGAMGGGGCSGSGSIAAEDHASVLTHLSTETVHYNPSDLFTWLENMLSEFNAPPSPLPPPVPSFSLDHPLPRQQLHQQRHRQTCDEPIGPAAKFSSINTANLLPCPPAAKSTIPCGYGSLPSEHLNKRIKATTSDSEETSSVRSGNDNVRGGVPVVLVDSQETGIRLVHTLVACAEAVQQGKLKAAEALVKQMGVLAMSQGGAMRKVATYFAEALACRIYRIHPVVMDGENLSSEAHFYEACPYLKFGHFTANQAILEAFAGKSRVHVIDLGMKQGMQWPALMQALALRPGGPPSFRLTGIGPPQPNKTDALEQVGWWLAQLAKTLHIQFEYRGLVANTLADLEPYMLTDNGGDSVSSVEVDDVDGDCEEAVAINAVLELHGLLGRPGAIDEVLGTMRAIRPSVVTVVEVEAEHNGPVFLDRFTEALHYYSSMFDSLEGGGGRSQQQQQLQQIQGMAEVYLGRQICNVVACEGPERTERHERMEQWRRRMVGAGFEAVHLGSNAYKQANMLLELSAAGDGYRVEEREGCLMLAWHTRPLITTSAWTIAFSNAPPPSTTGRSSPPFKFDDHTYPTSLITGSGSN